MEKQNAPVQVDVLLVGGTVLTMDAARHVYAPGAVAINGQDIVAVGPEAEIVAAYQAREVIPCQGHYILPGLINTHTHAPMSLLRGLADDLRLEVWLYGYILPVEREYVNPEFCFLGTMLSCAEMLSGGTTCFVDMYYHEEEVAWAAAEVGMRGICGETIVKYPTPDSQSFEEGLRYCQDFVVHWHDHALIRAVPAPHSIYMTTPEILEATTALAREYGVPQMMHLSETEEEVGNLLGATALRPVRWLEEHGILEVPLIAAHCVHVNSEEIQLLARYKVGVAHNPTSNLKLASGIAPVAEMLQRGVCVGVGTDGPASNNDLDLFEEMRLAALLPKAMTRNPVAVPAEEALAMATINGARAIGLDHYIGSLEPGKRADVIVVKGDGLHHLPPLDARLHSAYSRIVYSTRASDVRDVWVNGKPLMREGTLLTIDVSHIVERASDFARRIARFLIQRETRILDKLVDIAPLQQGETFEVQAKGALRDLAAFEQALKHPDIHLVGHSSREQFDTYFLFDHAPSERLRYREDQVIHPDGTLEPIYTLTLTGPAREAEYERCIVLSRARYTAPADRSLRFYREYFKPSRVIEIHKHRERYHIRYKGLDFAVNLDQILAPRRIGPFVEIKSRTWSQKDAMQKAALIGDLLEIFGAHPEDMLPYDYVDLFVREDAAGHIAEEG